MKKIILTAFLVVSIAFSLSSANAALVNVDLGLPDILSDQTGIYTYTWDTNIGEGLFTARATPFAISFDGKTVEPITGAASYTASFYVDGSGNLTGGVGGDDLVITGDVGTYSGNLITGEISSFGWQAAVSVFLILRLM